MKIGDCWKILADVLVLFMFVTGVPEKGMTGRERERKGMVWCVSLACSGEAVIMTGRRETTAKERDSKTRHKSCDGSACHIDEAMLREVGNGVSSAWGTYSNFQFYQFGLSLTL